MSTRLRHGGWYVQNVRYPSRAIVCHPVPFEQQPTFKTRDDAAQAEYVLAAEAKAAAEAGSLELTPA